jgi:hypothetical protein
LPTCWNLAAESYTVVKHASIDYLAPRRGILKATGCTDVKALQQAKDQLVGGLPVQVEVPVTVTDGDGAEVAMVQFTVAIRPRRTPQ